MKRWIKITLSIIVTFIILFLIAGGIFYSMLRSSLPEYSGEIKSEKISSDIEIYFDSLAIPYVFAESDEDVAFALGFLHARERLFFMDLARRAGEGKLSEVFGEETLPFDKMFRTVGIKRKLEKNLSRFDKKVMSILKSYSDGVNKFIEDADGNIAPEFDVLGYEPEKWEPIHSLLMIKMMAWELNMSWWIDISFAELIQKLGEDKVLEILPDYPENKPLIVPADYKNYTSIKSGLMETDKRFRKWIGFTGTHLGSNNWVIDSSLSSSGKPIIANDPHLAFSAPGKWYAVVLNGNDWKAAGVTLPGIPGIAIGKNKNISWTLTNLMNDDTDFYIEKIDSSGEKYFVDDEWHSLKIIEDTIFIKDAKEVVYEIKETHRGPIISGIHPFTLLYNDDKSYLPVISIQWLGNEFSDEMSAFLKINKAKNWNEFKSGVREFTLPAQNFVYGDAEGNIGYVMGAKIPLRKSGNPTLLFDGTTTENDWKGFVPQNQLPAFLNPVNGYIATANNKVTDDFPHHISNLWEPSSRIDRITELLEEKENHSVEDYKNYQLDMISPYAEEITRFLLNAFEGVKITDENLKKSIQLLEEWNYELNKSSQTASIYIMFLDKILKNIFYDEMGYELFNKFVFIANVPYRSLLQVLNDPASTWFDDVNTNRREGRDEIIRKSLADALTQLEQDYGKELVNWQWGEIHQLTFRHPFSGAAGLLDDYINIGPFNVGGDGTTLFNTEYPFFQSIDSIPLIKHEKFENVLGPSMRFIFDFAEPDRFYLVLTTGQSGHTMSDHYSDMTEYWLDGKYFTISTDEEKIKTEGNKLLRILSAK